MEGRWDNLLSRQREGIDGYYIPTQHGDAAARDLARAVRARRHRPAGPTVATDGRPRAACRHSHSSGSVARIVPGLMRTTRAPKGPRDSRYFAAPRPTFIRTGRALRLEALSDYEYAHGNSARTGSAGSQRLQRTPSDSRSTVRSTRSSSGFS